MIFEELPVFKATHASKKGDQLMNYPNGKKGWFIDEYGQITTDFEAKKLND